MIYVTYIKSDQANLTHLHAQAIKRINPEANILYVSKSPVKVATGTKNIHGVDIEQDGYNSFLNLLTSLKLIAKNYDKDICIISITSVLIGNVEEVFSDKVNFAGFMSNSGFMPVKSIYYINIDVIEKIIHYLSKKVYWDIFKRDPHEVLSGLALLVEDENKIQLLQSVLPKAENALFAYFNSGFYTDIQRLKTILLCVEVDNLPYLAPYLQARLDLNEAIKRAMQHVLHVFKK